MGNRSKYDFEPMFSKEIVAATSKAPRKKILTEADVEAARAEGFAEGERSEVAQTERAAVESLRAIARLMQMTLGRLSEEAHSLRVDAVEVALSSAKAIAGAALERFGDQVIIDIVSEATSHLRETPRLVVRVAPELVSVIEERLIGCAHEAGFTGEIVVRADPAAQMGDCILDWGDGVITHSRAAAIEAVEAATRNWLNSADAEGLHINLTQT
jgi:flagellar assembly protein FliH